MKKNGVIAFCGSKGSGKSTSALVFKEVFEGPTEELAIAGHLKEVCAEAFDIDYDKFINPALKEVELAEYIVLGCSNIEAVLTGFFVTDYLYDAHVRPHIGRIARTPRALLQYIGTEVLHPIDPLIHVKAAMKKKDKTKLTLITDLRFVAEFNYFNESHANEFLAVYVKNAQAELRASVDSHPSEREFDSFKLKCLPLNNEGTISDLRSGITALVRENYE